MADRVSSHDAAIWHTVDINQRIERGGLEQRAAVPTVFRPHLGQGERVLSQGEYRLGEFAPLGDGTYVHNSGAFFATGAAGLAMTGLFAAGRAVGNSRRKARAAADAQPQWRQIAVGAIFVSTHGFYFHEAHGLFSWRFGAVSGMEVVGPGAVTLTGESDRGQIYWLLHSDWAELVFSLWARAMHPGHPQLISLAWIPPAWQERMVGAGYELPSVDRREISHE